MSVSLVSIFSGGIFCYGVFLYVSSFLPFSLVSFFFGGMFCYACFSLFLFFCPDLFADHFGPFNAEGITIFCCLFNTQVWLSGSICSIGGYVSNFFYD